MEQTCVMVLGQLLAAYAEIEGMKSLNKTREMNGMALAWDESAFYEKAEEIRSITNQLFR